MDGTKIQWTDATWNPIRGCTRISPGCVNCYAEKVAARFSGPGMPYEGTITKGRWNGRIRDVPDALDQPLRWKRPRRIFVNSMSDLFHENMDDVQIERILLVMMQAPQHTFQVLTKRADRMQKFLSSFHTPKAGGWPLPNVWWGVSVENQEMADKRIPLLLRTPAAVRWISAEPLLEHLDLKLTAVDRALGTLHSGPLDWVVVGGESGVGARPFDLGWAWSIVQQCGAAGVPVFVKQLGARPYERRVGVGTGQPEPEWHNYIHRFKDKKGGDMEEWPPELRVRQWPNGHAVAA